MSDVPGIARDVVRGVLRDHSFHYAAGTAFRTSLAIFPLLIVLLSMLSVLGVADRAGNVLGVLARSDAVPSETTQALARQLGELQDPGPNQLLGAVAALALALWAGSAAFRTVISALNRALDLHEHRPLVRRFFVSLGLAALTFSLAVAATIVVAVGPAIGEQIRGAPGDPQPLFLAWRLVKWPLVALLVFGWLAITYAWGPAERRRFRLVTPGIVVAFVAWLAFALLFSWYVDAVADQGRLYGTFAGLVAFQLYIYWSALIVLVGAQIDCVLRQRGGRRERSTGR